MRALQLNKIFFSAYLAERSLEANSEAHAELREMLDNCGVLYRVVTGVYKGATELSFMLASSDAGIHEGNVHLALDLARQFKQESVLEVHNDGTAMLHRVDQEFAYSDKLGTFHETTELDALTRDSYTLDRTNGKFYVID